MSDRPADAGVEALLARAARLERALFFRSWIAIACLGGLLALAFWPRSSIDLQEGERRARLEPGRLLLADGTRSRVEIDTRGGQLHLAIEGPTGELRFEDDGSTFQMKIEIGARSAWVRIHGDILEASVQDGTAAAIQYRSDGDGASWYAGSSKPVIRTDEPLPRRP